MVVLYSLRSSVYLHNLTSKRRLSRWERLEYPSSGVDWEIAGGTGSVGNVFPPKMYDSTLC